MKMLSEQGVSICNHSKLVFNCDSNFVANYFLPKYAVLILKCLTEISAPNLAEVEMSITVVTCPLRSPEIMPPSYLISIEHVV